MKGLWSVGYWWLGSTSMPISTDRFETTGDVANAPSPGLRSGRQGTEPVPVLRFLTDPTFTTNFTAAGNSIIPSDMHRHV